MSVDQKVQEAIEKLQKVQFTRRQARMAREFGEGEATFLDSVGKIVVKSWGRIILRNCSGHFVLYVGVSSFPCNRIQWYNCINATIHFHLKEFFAANKVILLVSSLDQVSRIIAYVNPPQKPRVLAYEHDGNITSSGSESEDSASGRTTTDEVNSFDSDNPSNPEN